MQYSEIFGSLVICGVVKRTEKKYIPISDDFQERRAELLCENRLRQKGTEDFGYLRKQEMKRLKKKLPGKEYKKPKGAMRALRKKNPEPGSDERDVLRKLFIHSPLLKTAYELCEELTYIFNRMISKQKARKELGIWAGVVRLSGLNTSENFLRTSEKHMEEIYQLKQSFPNVLRILITDNSSIHKSKKAEYFPERIRL